MDIRNNIREILKQEAEAILNVAVTEAFEHAVVALESCPSKVVATGIGKAGHIARKFAATLSSTGTPAIYLHPSEAAHGDLGVIGSGDCLVAFSTSGKSLEVLEMLELSRHLNPATIIGITSHPDSKLRDLSDIILDMGEVKEPCPLGLTPTASVAVMLAISDALALTVMQRKGVTREQYGLRHHGGYLGKKARVL
jgi:arabinose-5-phosphate isomerase